MLRTGARLRIWVETTCGVLAAIAALATLLWRDWIERVLPFEPDGGSGALEVAITLALFLLSVSSSALAVAERRRRPPEPAPASR